MKDTVVQVTVEPFTYDKSGGILRLLTGSGHALLVEVVGVTFVPKEGNAYGTPVQEFCELLNEWNKAAALTEDQFLALRTKLVDWWEFLDSAAHVDTVADEMAGVLRQLWPNEADELMELQKKKGDQECQESESSQGDRPG